MNQGVRNTGYEFAYLFLSIKSNDFVQIHIKLIA
jgi:hypothetical protein